MSDDQEEATASRKRKRTRDLLAEMANELKMMKEKMKKLEEEEEESEQDESTSRSEENNEDEKVDEKESEKENVKVPMELEAQEQNDECEFFMGAHPDKNKVGEASLSSEIADRLCVWIKEGIDKEEKVNILQVVPRKYKQCNMNAPKLNEEIIPNLKEEALKRDRYFSNYQNMIGSSLALTASALNMVLIDKEEPVDREILLQYLSDSVKINADLFHSWTIARKIYITPGFEPKIKKALDKAEATEFLFGDNVKDLINKVRTVEQVGKNLKPAPAKKPLSTNNSVNWRGPSGKREVNQTGQKQSNYYASRNQFNQKNSRRPFQRRQYHQSQPLQQYHQSQPLQQKKE